MKQRRLAAVLTAALLLLLAGCGRDNTEDTPPEPFIAHPLSGFTWESTDWDGLTDRAVSGENAARIPIADADEILTEAKIDGSKAAVVYTKAHELYAALGITEGYNAFYRIPADARPNSIRAESFTGVLGKIGLHLSYDADDRTADVLFFADEGDVPLRMVPCRQNARPVGNMLVQISGDKDGAQMHLYRETEGTLYRCDLNREIRQIFPDAEQILLHDLGNHRYGEHDLLAEIEIRSSENPKYVVWLTDDSLCLLDEADTVLPPYTYTPAALPAEGAGYEWIYYNLHTDFVLREHADPLSLSQSALKKYMDEAYAAGWDVVCIAAGSPSRLANTVTVYSNTPCYYVQGRRYYDTQHPAFPSLSAWETYMRRILSEELVEELLARNIFIELDGKLYAERGILPSDPNIGDAGSYIAEVTDTEIVYVRWAVVRGPSPEDDETVRREFRYTKTADGWLWTELYLYN